MLRAASDYRYLQLGSADRVTGDILPVREMAGARTRALGKEDPLYLMEASLAAQHIAGGARETPAAPGVELSLGDLDACRARLFEACRFPFVSKGRLATGANFQQYYTFGESGVNTIGPFAHDIFLGAGCAMDSTDLPGCELTRALRVGGVRELFAAVGKMGYAAIMIKEGYVRLKSRFISPRIEMRRAGAPLGDGVEDGIDCAGDYFLRYLPSGRNPVTSVDGAQEFPRLAPLMGYAHLQYACYSPFSEVWSAYCAAEGANWRRFSLYGREEIGSDFDVSIMCVAADGSWRDFHPLSDYGKRPGRDDAFLSRASVDVLDMELYVDYPIEREPCELCFVVGMGGASFGGSHAVRGLYRIAVDPSWFHDREGGGVKIVVPARYFESAQMESFFASSGLVGEVSRSDVNNLGTEYYYYYARRSIMCFGVILLARPHYEISSTGWQG